MVVSAGYTRRLKVNNFGSRNVAVPESTYQKMVVTEKNSQQTVTVYNQDPALRGKQDFVWTNESDFDSTYNGMDFTLDKRFSNGWMMTGGISIGETNGWVGNNDLNNPNSKEFARGIVGNDTPFSFRLSGLYDLPYGIQASGTFQHQKGFPELTTVSVGQRHRGPDPGHHQHHRRAARHDAIAQPQSAGHELQEGVSLGQQGDSAAPRRVQPAELGDGDQPRDDAWDELRGGWQHPARGLDKIRRKH